MDQRSRVEKLAAMAQQDASPAEAEIAKTKLQASGNWPPPPSFIQTAGLPPDEPPHWTVNWGTTSNPASFTFEIRVKP